MRGDGGAAGAPLFSLTWSESLLLSLAGAGFGVPLTVALRGGVEWMVRLTLPFVPLGTVVEVAPWILFQSSLLVVGLCLLAGVYLAWRSAVVSPMTSMRGAI